MSITTHLAFWKCLHDSGRVRACRYCSLQENLASEGGLPGHVGPSGPIGKGHQILRKWE